jgi:hypothetical protein
VPAEPTSIFCDGSISNAVLTDPFTSELRDEFVGRVIVLVPSQDYGLIEQVRQGVVTPRGTPNSVAVEALAIRSALTVGAALRAIDHVVFSDCREAVRALGDQRVEWRCREQMYLPNSFFDKVLRRASYLRQSSKRGVKRRNPISDHQQEVFELFNASRREFRLSDSALWARVTQDVRRHDEALGVSAAPPAVSRRRDG